MADRLFQPGAGFLEVGVVTVYGTVTIGASGAVTGLTSKGIKSVTRTGTGAYTVALTDAYPSILSGAVHTMDPSGAAHGAQLATASVSGTTPQVTFQCYSSGSAADPNSGATLFIALTLKNSSV